LNAIAGFWKHAAMTGVCRAAACSNETTLHGGILRTLGRFEKYRRSDSENKSRGYLEGWSAH
jgi:hypothetical protein